MDNFKKFQKPKYYSPLDGVSPPQGKSNQSRKQIGFPDKPRHFGRHKAAAVEAVPVDDFRRPDGYISAQKSVAMGDPIPGSGAKPAEVGAVALSEAVEPEPKAHKKRWFRRHKNNAEGRHGAKKRLSWPKRILRLSIALILCVLLTGGFLFLKGYLATNRIFRGDGAGAPALEANVDPTKLNGEGDGRINILLLGKGGDGHEGPDLTDTIIVASIDPVNKQAALLSIPRDFYVKGSGNSSYTKINEVYADAKYSVLNGPKTSDQAEKAEKAGLDAIEKTISTTIGIPIHYYAMIDFTAFQEAVNAVGGVDINVTDSVFEHMSFDGHPYILNVPVGVQHFDGLRALMYSRSRYTSARGDFDRSQRQRAMILALKDKALSLGTFTNPIKVSQLIDTLGNRMRTSLSLKEVMRLYDIGKDISGDKVQSLSLVDPPHVLVHTDGINGLSVVVPVAGIGNYKDIQSFVRNSLKDSYISQENASIIILNGTDTVGLATKTSDELKSYGYNVTAIADAPTSNYTNTVLIDLRNGTKKYTQHYLENRFGLTASSNLPDSAIQPGTADFVIILGKNEATRLQNQAQ